jgi:hypothetical protein
MRYDFSPPLGWTVGKLPDGGRGLVLQAPPTAEASERAALFLLDPLSPVGALAEQLGQAMQTSLAGVEVVRRGATQPVTAAAYPGLLCPVRVRLPVASPSPAAGATELARPLPEEGRVYFLLQTPQDRLLVVFVGGQKALPKYQAALDEFLGSIRPAPSRDSPPAATSPYGGWGE